VDVIGFDTQIMPQVGGCDVFLSISATLAGSCLHQLDNLDHLF
jgi:hypothetical protein